ncbi:hypothetical protein [Campylobacter troglodytis]|uniref:hypothetical protein n=1 Tax=Campylobacter troglodytis TaxID=654363 RepID=UPI00115B18E3|nr:hypothetical protein [Campylobacter troglodytis]TQR61170.1 hypothetical protein DMC01_02560 [Campylobacter troglodytis]
MFLGYGLAGLQGQLQALDIVVDKENPLYLPCQVGAAPRRCGLKHIFGENVKCFFAKPSHPV